MRKITTVRPKELNLFNRNFGNLKQYVLKNIHESTFQDYLREAISERLFEKDLGMNNKSCEILLKFVAEEYLQQIEDHLQIITLSNDIILKNEYDDMKRKSIRCSKKNITTLDIIIEVFLTENFIKYLCEEEIFENKGVFSQVRFSVQKLTKEDVIGDIYFIPKQEIKDIKLPEAIVNLIDEVIKLYPGLKGKRDIILTSFISKALVTADMLLHCKPEYLYILSQADNRYLEAVKAILSKLEAWKSQLFLSNIKRKFEMQAKEIFNADDILSEIEKEYNEEEQEEFKQFLENNFLTNITFGLLLYNENAITLFYKQNNEKQNIIKNFVVKLSEKLKENFVEELKDFNIHDLENENVSKQEKELAATIQLYIIDYKWLELYVRDDQVKKKEVDVKAWNLYNNITKAVLNQSIYGFEEVQGKTLLKKMVQVQGKYSLNNLCQKDFDELAFSCLVIAFYEKDITKDDFIEEQLKMGVSKELINLFFNLIEE